MVIMMVMGLPIAVDFATQRVQLHFQGGIGNPVIKIGKAAFTAAAQFQLALVGIIFKPVGSSGLPKVSYSSSIPVATSARGIGADYRRPT